MLCCPVEVNHPQTYINTSDNLHNTRKLYRDFFPEIGEGSGQLFQPNNDKLQSRPKLQETRILCTQLKQTMPH